MILLDTGGLLAALVADEVRHEEALAVLSDEGRPLVLSQFVLAELDYLLRVRGGPSAQLALLEQVATDVYELASFSAADVRVANGVISQYADLGISLADASIVVLASRYQTDRVLTLDERDFRVLRTPDGRPFTLLPADV